MSRTKLTQNSIAAGALNANTMFAADVISPHAIANTSTYSVAELLVAGQITVSGGDTSAGDNAALGYTAAEGLILTGQGSTSDITLKNDADATVFTVPTGQAVVRFPDSAKATFGASDDLQIYHNGTDSYITDVGTGVLKITTDGGSISFQKSNSEVMATMAVDGAIQLNYDNALKLATTSTGATVTGGIISTGTVSTLSIDGTAPSATGADVLTVMRAANAGSYADLNIVSGNTGKSRINFGDTDDMDVGQLHYDHNSHFMAFSTATAERMRINATGIGIGTTSPNGPLHVVGDSNITGHASVGAAGVTAGSRALTVVGATDGTGSSIIVGYNSSLASKFSVRDDGYTVIGAGLNVTGTVTSTLLDVNSSGASTIDSSGGPALQVTQSTAGENAIRVIGSHASFTGNVLQPWAVRAASSAFDLIECVANNGAQVPWRVRGDGYTSIGVAMTSTWPLNVLCSGNYGAMFGTNAAAQVRISDSAIQAFSDNSTATQLNIQGGGGQVGIGVGQTTGVGIRVNGNSTYGLLIGNCSRELKIGASGYQLVDESSNLLFQNNADAEKMRVGDNGYVGIGMSAGTGLLSITSPAWSTNALTLYSATTGGGQADFCGISFHTAGVQSANIYTAEGNDISITTDASIHLKTGSVGISGGTARLTITAAGLLEVTKDQDIDHDIGRSTIGTFASDYAVFSHIDRSPASDFALAQQAGGFTLMNAAAGQYIRFRIGNVEKAAIDSNGLFGIGTTSPSAALHVVRANASFFLQGAGNTTLYTENTTGTVRGGLQALSNQSVRVGSVTAYATEIVYNNAVKGTASSSGFAVTGALSKSSGSFRIAHPVNSKKHTHDLVHSFIEGPKADLIYRGKVDLVSGSATVNVDTASGMTDGTFVLLCQDVQCYTSNETGWTAIKGSVSGNVLTITAQDDSCTDTVSWLVIGERKDDHMIETSWTDSDGHVIVEPIKIDDPLVPIWRT